MVLLIVIKPLPVEFLYELDEVTLLIFTKLLNKASATDLFPELNTVLLPPALVAIPATKPPVEPIVISWALKLISLVAMILPLIVMEPPSSVNFSAIFTDMSPFSTSEML